MPKPWFTVDKYKLFIFFNELNPMPILIIFRSSTGFAVGIGRVQLTDPGKMIQIFKWVVQPIMWSTYSDQPGGWSPQKVV